MNKYKIDVYEISSRPYGLYRWKGYSWWGQWIIVQVFETKDAAKAYWNTIKELPEYLP